MDENKLYGKWNFWQEIIGYPLMLYYWIRGKQIQQLLSHRIDRARLKADKVLLKKKKKDELLIEYENICNFFSYHFKKIDSSRNHNFQEKIAYCLEQYKIESSKQLSAARLMILQENFLNGAENTLFLYFALEGKVTSDIHLSDIIIGRKNTVLFLDFLRENKFIDENSNLLVDNKSSFIRLHRFLKDHKIINPDFQDTTIIEAMENEYGTNFDKGTFSRAIMVKPNEFEQVLYQKLAKILNLEYQG